jgi:hypothetical protein
MTSAIVLAALLASAPAASAAPVAAPASEPYGANEATVDVDTILKDTSKAYLQARGRLVAHPEVAARALVERLETPPPPTGGERKRILDVLAEIGGADNTALFAKELRTAVTQAEGDARALVAAEVWRPLLRDQGAHAMKALIDLVADKDLPLGVRAALLDDLVEVTPTERLPDLLVFVGRGHTTLRQQFARSLRRRVLRDEALRAALGKEIDREIESADAGRLAALVQLRVAIDDTVDPAFVERLVALATDAKREFPVRVAAVRGLALQETDASAQAGLAKVASEALAAKTTQKGEILAWLALGALPAEQAAALSKAHDLVHADAPRLVERAWAVVPLPASQTWLDDAFADPWPQVRRAALGRVKGPCDRTLSGKLRAKIGEREGDRDASVQRAAVEAIGRCGGDRSFALLSAMLDDADVHTEQSAEAARQLARHYGARGADAVAKRLDRSPEPSWGRRLAQALRHTETPTPRVRDSLCNAAEAGGEVGRAAQQSLIALWPEESDRCVEE